MSARFVSTTRLSNIVQMITLARQSGILRIVRGHGAARELGQIRFVDGEPITALLGQVTGQMALNVLLNWGECLYAFDEGPQVEAYGSEAAWSSSSGPSMTSPLPDLMDGSWPSYGYGGSFDASSPSAQSSPAPFVPGMTSPLQPSSYPAASMPPSYTSAPSAPVAAANDPTGDLEALAARRLPYAGPATATAPNMSPMPAEISSAVPVRAAIAEQVEQLPLDRRERMVLLLVDGQRTVSDLMRLVRRNQAEVYAVLHHLRMLGLIDFRR